MNAGSALLSQSRYNLLASLRTGSSVAVGIVLPVALYLGMSLLFGSESLGGDNPVPVRGAGDAPDLRTFLVGGFMAYAALYSGFVALTPELVEIRERGLLKRLRGTPMPLSIFVAARLTIALLITALAVAAIGLLGWAVFGITPQASVIVPLVVYTVVGTVTFTFLGFALATLVRSSATAQGVTNAVALVLAMISGVFFSTEALPEAVTTAAQVLPLEPLANALQALYVPGAEDVGLDPRNLGVLAAWALVAVAVVALRGFHWQPRLAR
ncbi:MAG: ABC transporter permease [Jiangellales bacterium]